MILVSGKEFDAKAELVRRLTLYERLRNDPDAQVLQMEKCRRDPYYFFDNFVWTYDPREADTNPFLPFLLYDSQVGLIDFVLELEEKQKEGVVEKSRDQGATEVMTGHTVWRWLFKRLWAGGWGSNLERSVDALDNPKAIFHKIRAKIDNLPHWMKPPGYNKRRHDNYLKIINPSNGATVTGEAGDQIGRGDRKSMYYIDEAAFIDRPLVVGAALSHTCKVKVWISTANGNGNPFYSMRTNPVYPVYTLFWKDDPRKNRWELIERNPHGGPIVCLHAQGNGYGPKNWKENASTKPGEEPEKLGVLSMGNGMYLRWPWYEAEKEKFKHHPVTVASEVDIDYTASVTGIAIPAKWVAAAVELLLITRSKARVAGLDIAGGGLADSVLIERVGPTVEEITSWGDLGPSASVLHAAQLADERRCAHLLYDSAGMGMDAYDTLTRTQRRYSFKKHPVNVGESPTEAVWPDGRTSDELFKNLKAELWWNLRLRFLRTYEFVNEGRFYKPDELISIPKDQELISQLSNVKMMETEDGKMRVETKDELQKRGVASPDRAEALVLCFATILLAGDFNAVAQAPPPEETVGGVPIVTGQRRGVALTPKEAIRQAQAGARKLRQLPPAR